MTEKKKSRAEVEAEVRQKISLEEKAFRWVEHLALVDSISEDELSKMFSAIMVSHYRDIIEERAISKVCGYPLCCTKLGKRSQNKYHISMKYNKVIDLSIRENFCSLYCFRASKFIEDQIPSDPIWLRDLDKTVEIKLLAREKGKKCEVDNIGEVPLGVTDVNKIEDASKHSSEKKKGKGDIFEGSSDSDECPDEIKCFDSDEEVGSDHTNDVKHVKKSNARKQTKLIDQKDIIKKEVAAAHQYFDKLKIVLEEWITKESLQHLYSLQKEPYDSDDTEEEEFFPETGDFQSKLANFLSRQPEWLSEARSVPTQLKKEHDSEGKSKKNVALPTVDSRSQSSIRRRIVHEKVASSLREILPLCGLLEEDLTEVAFFKLVDTFNFTSKNIVLNSKQWTSMTIILLIIISRVYRNKFGGIISRLKDINDFLIMRSLPNLSQVEEMIKIVLDKVVNIGKGDVHATGTDNCNKAKANIEENTVQVTSTEIPASYYYDNMEEVD